MKHPSRSERPRGEPAGAPRPRSVARTLLRRAAGRDFEAVQGDLLEAWAGERARRGGLVAWAWYWGQVGAVCWYSRRDRRPELRPWLALRLAARGVRRDPLTAFLAVLTLALGLSFATVLYGFLAGARRDLPVPRGHEVVRVEVVQPSRGGRALPIEPETASEWRAAGVLVELGLYRQTELVFDDGDGYARRHGAAELSAEVLPLLQVQPVLGRSFAADDRNDTAMLIGYDVWQSDFGGDPGVIGREVRTGQAERTVIGIMPPGFGFPLSHSAWLPLDPRPGEPLEGVEVVARLRAGLEPRDAVAGLQTIWARRDASRGAEQRGGEVEVLGFTRGRGEGGEAVAFGALAAIVFGLLVVACLNSSTLLLVRAARRSRLVGIQTALGAGGAQVALQSFLEALIIAAVGGAAGLGLAALALRQAQRVLSVHFGYYWMRMELDASVATFTAMLVVGAAVAAGTLPALRAARAHPHDVLKSGGPGSAGGLGRAAGWFIGIQVTAATASLVAAVLMAGGLAYWGGFRRSLPEQPVVVASYDVAPPSAPVDAPAAAPRRYDFALRVLEQAGVDGASAALGVYGFGEASGTFELDGELVEREIDRSRATWNAVTPGYFDLFGLETVAGSALAAPGPDEAAVAVVSRSFASRFLSGTEPIGRRVRLPAATGDRWSTIVGVVEDAATGRAEPSPADARVYFAFSQLLPERGMLLLPAGSDAVAAAGALRRAARLVDPDVPLRVSGTLEEFFTWLTRIPRVIGIMGISGALAGLAVMAVGLFGLLSFYVRQHLFELGIRVAVGAGAASIARVVLRRAGMMLLPGMTVGLILMYAAAPAFGIFLFGTDPHRPGPFLGVAAAMLLVGLLAAAGPLRRALRVQPADVLRAE